MYVFILMIYRKVTRKVADHPLKPPKFAVADSVYIKATATQSLRGPYTVSEVLSNNNKCKLEHNKTSIDNGKEFSEGELQKTT